MRNVQAIAPEIIIIIMKSETTVKAHLTCVQHRCIKFDTNKKYMKTARDIH